MAPDPVAADPVAVALAAIREHEQKATPGPWVWRGNMDNGDPRLVSAGSVTDERGRRHGAGDVLGHVPHEITAEEARRRVSTDCLPEPQVDPLPADTYHERYDAALEAQVEAEVHFIRTDKHGEPEKEERLAFCTDWLYAEARELAVYEVAPQATSRDDPRVYRADIVGIRHPDAEFIAYARSDVPRLLAAVEAVLALHQPGRIVVLGSLCKHHESCRHFSITSTEAAGVAACADCAATVYNSCTGCGAQIPLDQCPARAAISRALLGEEGSGDH